MICRCNRCEGKKTVMALGNLQKDCPDCGATGYVEKPLKKNDVRQTKRKKKPKNILSAESLIMNNEY